MPNKVRIRNLRAADPGIGFYLDLSDVPTGTQTGQFDSNKNLKVHVSITDPNGSAVHECISVIEPTLNPDDELTVVLPFACNDYAGGVDLRLVVNVTQNGLPLSGSPTPAVTVQSESGKFNFGVTQTGG